MEVAVILNKDEIKEWAGQPNKIEPAFLTFVNKMGYPEVTPIKILECERDLSSLTIIMREMNDNVDLNKISISVIFADSTLLLKGRMEIVKQMDYGWLLKFFSITYESIAD